MVGVVVVRGYLVGSTLLVGLSLGVVRRLVHLVTQSVLGSAHAVKKPLAIQSHTCNGLDLERCVNLPSSNVGVVVLGNLLVGLLGGLGGGALDGLSDVVGSVLDGVHCGLLVVCLLWVECEVAC
jgi:hypothetical protein